MTQSTKHSAQPMPTKTTKMPKHDPDLFDGAEVSWEELRERWAKAQRGI
mgnify:CR=1 FL=1